MQTESFAGIRIHLLQDSPLVSVSCLISQAAMNTTIQDLPYATW